MLVKLEPALKSYLWGGTKLISRWNKRGGGETLSEAWELSFHAEGLSRVRGGQWDGALLRDVVPRSLWGENCSGFPFFPVLTKLIDAAQPLSVQVHPSDEYALAHEGQYGKTELWHILEAEEGAFLYLGLRRDTSPAQFGEALAEERVCELLNRVPVRAGDTFFIPPGTLHAIGAGVTLFEVQQNSSLTYRVYDYGRRDAAGNLRELHTEKAIRVINWKGMQPCNRRGGDLLGECPYFTAVTCGGGARLGAANSFASATVIRGSGQIGGLAVGKGDTVFLSAGEYADLCGDLSCVAVAVGSPI